LVWLANEEQQWDKRYHNKDRKNDGNDPHLLCHIVCIPIGWEGHVWTTHRGSKLESFYTPTSLPARPAIIYVQARLLAQEKVQQHATHAICYMSASTTVRAPISKYPASEHLRAMKESVEFAQHLTYIPKN
jgi:hypothetical protein